MDSIPVVLMEAMLSDVPVITTCISGIPELVEDGLTGLLCEPNDALCLTKMIQDLIKNNERRKEFRSSAISKVKADFELSDNVKRLSILLDNL